MKTHLFVKGLFFVLGRKIFFARYIVLSNE
jgi:hypothetical protein